MDKKQFWEVEHKEFVDGVVVKFKKLSSLDVLDLADRNIGSGSDSKQFKLDCLRNVKWTKNGETWFDLMDEDGNCTLPEMSSATLLDVFFTYRREVCLPVFTESKTYHQLQEVSVGTSKKHENK